jgi:hypothetical protein
VKEKGVLVSKKLLIALVIAASSFAFPSAARAEMDSSQFRSVLNNTLPALAKFSVTYSRCGIDTSDLVDVIFDTMDRCNASDDQSDEAFATYKALKARARIDLDNSGASCQDAEVAQDAYDATLRAVRNMARHTCE